MKMIRNNKLTKPSKTQNKTITKPGKTQTKYSLSQNSQRAQGRQVAAECQDDAQMEASPGRAQVSPLQA